MGEFEKLGLVITHLSHVLRRATSDLRLKAAVSQERAGLLWDKYEPRPLKFMESM